MARGDSQGTGIAKRHSAVMVVDAAWQHVFDKVESISREPEFPAALTLMELAAKRKVSYSVARLFIEKAMKAGLLQKTRDWRKVRSRYGSVDRKTDVYIPVASR